MYSVKYVCTSAIFIAHSVSQLPGVLPSLAKSHHAALSIAAKNYPPRSIRSAHSLGVTKWLSVPNPTYARRGELHIVQGGIANGDKRLLERVARGSQCVPLWVVPKSVTVGDEVVIYIGTYGFFATGRIRSRAEPKTGWANRYGADLGSIKLIEPPISLAAIRRHIPSLGWAKYPRSVATPPPNMADQIRALINKRRKTGVPEDLDGAALASANIDELRKVALLRARRFATRKEREIVYRARSEAIRLYVLCRANGQCEGCRAAAPFRRADGSPFLESHHTERLADEGPDHPWKVVGLCPNCHRRAHYGEDASAFNASLIRKLAKLEPTSKKADQRATLT